MTPEEVVTQAVASLERGDVAGHLSYVAEQVAFEINDGGPHLGKTAYGVLINMVVSNLQERVLSFQVADAVPLENDLVVVRVDEEHRVTVPPNAKPGEGTLERRATVPVWYTVHGGQIVRIRLAALSGTFDVMQEERP